MLRHVHMPTSLRVWGPCCGRGDMVAVLRERFISVQGSDVFDYGQGFRTADALTCEIPPCDLVVTNPPFRLAEPLILRWLSAGKQVAVLVRTAFLESAQRYNGLFKPQPPSFVFQYVERVPMLRGRLVRNASTATAYAWVMWTKKEGGTTEFCWIPPSRSQVERDDDWPKK